MIASVAIWVLVAGGFGAARADTSVKLATWNLNWLTLRHTGDPALPADVTTRDPVDFTHLAGFARRLDADIVAVEEVDGDKPLSLLFPPPGWRITMTDDQVIQRVGLATRDGIGIERHPDVTALDVEPNAPHRLRSGLDVTLTVQGTPFRLLAVHLKTGCWGARQDQQDRGACKALDRQIPVLQAWIGARAAEHVPFVVLGDFNRRMISGDRVLDALENAAPLDNVTERLGDPCWGETRPFIDTILLGGPARSWLVPDSVRVLTYGDAPPDQKDHLSDHCPVSVRLDIPAN